MKNIVIVGAGFGGLTTAIGLERKLKSGNGVSITLIDKRDYHLFTPNLFEAATTEEDLVTQKQVKASIVLPLKEILQGKKIKFLQGSLTDVDFTAKKITVGSKQVGFDFLVLALGSMTEYFNIPGALDFSLPLKSLPDALRIRNQVEFAIQAHRLDANKPNVRIVVAGGGYAGVELAGELKGLADFIAWKNNYPRRKIEIEIIEAANQLVPGFDSRLSDDLYDRLESLGMRITLSSKITQVDEHFITLMNGEKIFHDVLIWTTGVRAAALLSEPKLEADGRGRIKVNSYLKSLQQENVFVLGDLACVLNADGKPVPQSAQDAIEQGRYLAKALPYFLQNKFPPTPYRPRRHGFIVNASGKWAIMSYGKFYAAGFLAFLSDKYAHWDYYIYIVGWMKAFKWLLFQMKIYDRNDM